jgi:hypothetical protein
MKIARSQEVIRVTGFASCLFSMRYGDQAEMYESRFCTCKYIWRSFPDLIPGTPHVMDNVDEKPTLAKDSQ